MNIYLDTEFIEGVKPKTWFFQKDSKPTIDLISIGLVDDEGRSFYAISNEFDLDWAWHKVQVTSGVDEKPYHWIRENVLRPIFNEMAAYNNEYRKKIINTYSLDLDFTKRNMRMLLQVYGKSRDSIKEGIIKWVGKSEPKFYAYYADYDWVAFCWLFGRMMDLPSNFPYHCIDLKQIADDNKAMGLPHRFNMDKGEHHALNDAKHDKAMYEFLMKARADAKDNAKV